MSKKKLNKITYHPFKGLYVKIYTIDYYSGNSLAILFYGLVLYGSGETNLKLLKLETFPWIQYKTILLMTSFENVLLSNFVVQTHNLDIIVIGGIMLPRCTIIKANNKIISSCL